MSERDLLRDAIRRPLPLPYHPCYRFYRGGALVRRFRGVPNPGDDWWSEDWVGSCTQAGNPDPSGKPQGLSFVEIPGLGPITVKHLVESFPEEMLGARFAERWGPTPAVLVKILSPAMPVPLHFHPSRDWASRHLDSRFGKVEGWIILEAPGDGREPANFSAGFRGGVTKEWFRAAVDGKDGEAMRGALNRTDIHPGEMYVAYPGVPHCMGPQALCIELQEPTDHMVVAEWSGQDETRATMGLGWDRALEILDYSPTTPQSAFGRARQRQSIVREKDQSRETRLVNPDVLEFWDATRIDVGDEIAVEDGRFYIGIATAGEGLMEGDFGKLPLRKGETFACAAALSLRYKAGHSPLQVVRCMGPVV